MKTRVSSVAVLVVLAASLAACSDRAPQTAPPQPADQSASVPSAPSPDTPVVPNSGAPKVENPLPRSVLDGEPCSDALTLADGLGIATPGKNNDTEALGIADDLSVDVSVSINQSKRGTLNPCDAATEAADMVIGNLRQKAGT